MCDVYVVCGLFFFKQKTAYDMRISDWSSDVCASDLVTVNRESALSITLGQGIARGDKMDWVLQKAAELGVVAIAPLRTQWTEVRLHAERAERRHQHWRGVIAAACEQCGRATLPALAPASELSDWADRTRTRLNSSH